MKVTLEQQTPNPIQFIAKIASICYGKDTASNPYNLVYKLYVDGHESVFEHVYFTFKIEGVSRVFSHQMVRHREASPTQRSQRYCEESCQNTVFPFKDERVDELMKQVYSLYDTLVEEGVAKEDARYILPNGAGTALYFSCNLRELIHICNERLCSHAQQEIRDVVTQMRSLVDKDLRWMLVPRCGRQTYVCMHPCKNMCKNIRPFEE